MKCAYKASTVSPPRVQPRAVRVRPLAAVASVQNTDMSVFTDARLVDGQDDTLYTDFFPATLNGAAQRKLFQRRTGMKFSLETQDESAAAVLASGIRPFAVGKPTKSMGITHFHVPSLVEANGSAAWCDIDESAAAVWWVSGDKGVAGWGAAEDDIACGEAYGDGAYTDLAGPYEGSVSRSVYLIMFVDSASR